MAGIGKQGALSHPIDPPSGFSMPEENVIEQIRRKIAQMQSSQGGAQALANMLGQQQQQANPLQVAIERSRQIASPDATSVVGAQEQMQRDMMVSKYEREKDRLRENLTGRPHLESEFIRDTNEAIAQTIRDFSPVGTAEDIDTAISDPSLLNVGIASLGVIPGGKPVSKALKGAKPRIATWFSGTGTMEAGLSDHLSVHAVEFMPDYMDAFNKAHKTDYFARDVTKVSPEEVAAANPDLFHASPVCKNFSAAKNKRTVEKGDLDTAESVANVIEEVRPPVVTIENAPQYVGTVPFNKIADSLTRSGYRWDVDVYDSADFGGTQSRKRMLVRAVRDGELPPLPQKTGGRDWFEAIQDLLPEAPDDVFGARKGAKNWELERIEGMVQRGLLDPSKPILTMGGSAFKGLANAVNAGFPAPVLKSTSREVPRIIFPDGRVKRVTPRMMARFMDLPDDFPLPESPKLAKEVLGNGMQGAFTKALIEPLVKR